MAERVDWVSRFADEVIAEAQRRAPGATIVCASGLSPSGPIHLGNLREVLTPHLVADEIRRRGVDCRAPALVGRLRPVPQGARRHRPGLERAHRQAADQPCPPRPAATTRTGPSTSRRRWSRRWSELGVESTGRSARPSSTPPAPTGSRSCSRWRTDGGSTRILDRYRTKDRPAPVVDDSLDEADRAAAQEAAEGSGAATEDDGATGAGYYPYKPYCGRCERDLTTVTAYDDAATALSYTCECGYAETVRLREYDRGKLVWKVDWPMRWAYEGVLFEPSGVDHSARLVLRRRRADRPRGVRRRAADRPDVRLRRHHRHGQDEQLQGRGADPGRRPGDHGGAGAALAVRPAPAQPVVQGRLRRGDPAALRRVGRARRAGSPTARAGRPTPPRYNRGHEHRRGAAAGHAAPGAVPHARLHRRRHHRRRGADAAHPARPRPGRPGPIAGRGPPPAGPRRSAGSRPSSRPSSAPGCATSRTPSCWRRSTPAAAGGVAAAAGRASTSTGRSTG